MFEETDGFEQDGDGFSQTHIPQMEEHPSTQNPVSHHDFSAVEMRLHHQFNMEMEHCYDSSTIQEMDPFVVGESEFQYLQQQPNPAGFIQNEQISSQSFTNGGYVPDFHNTFHPPRRSPHPLLQNSSITLSNTGLKSPGFLASLGLLGELNPSPADGSSASASVIYDPLLPMNLPPQTPLLRELFHSLPNGDFTLGGSRNGSSLFGGVDEGDGLYQCDGRNFESGVFEFAAGAGEIDCVGKNRDGMNPKHFATERHRRVLLNDKFEDLRRLLPNNTKNVRATILGDAIDYINELKRSVAELKVLVEKRRCARERLKRTKTEDDDAVAPTGNEMMRSVGDMNQENGSLRSSWLHRKSKNTEIDVRIVDDEVTVKLIQQKRINCLLFVSKVLDELQLDLHHVAGGVIGDYYSFLFNSKICEGSIVYASSLANKLIEVVDKQYAAIPSSSSY